MERQLSVTLMYCHKVYVFANSERLNDIKIAFNCISTDAQQWKATTCPWSLRFHLKKAIKYDAHPHFVVTSSSASTTHCVEEVAGFFSQEVFEMQEYVWGLAWVRILNEDVWEKLWDSADPPSYCPNKADMPFFLLGFTSPSLPILSTLNKHLYNFRILSTMFPVSIRCFPPTFILLNNHTFTIYNSSQVKINYILSSLLLQDTVNMTVCMVLLYATPLPCFLNGLCWVCKCPTASYRVC